MKKLLFVGALLSSLLLSVTARAEGPKLLMFPGVSADTQTALDGKQPRNVPLSSSKLYCYNHTALPLYAADGWTSAPLVSTIVASCAVPGGDMGANGVLRIRVNWSYQNSANNKYIYTKFGGSTVSSSTKTTTSLDRADTFVANRNIENSQLFGTLQTPGAAATAFSTGSIDTTASTTLTFMGQTTLETGFQSTALVGAAGVCTATKATHGLLAGEYIKVSSGGNCPTSGDPNADPVPILTRPDANTITYACSCVGTEAGVQPTIQRYSAMTLESFDVELVKP